MSEKKEIVMNGAGVAELGFPGWPQFDPKSKAEIAEALEKQEGIALDKRKVVIDPIKTTGVYTAKCKLGYEIPADLKVEVKEG